MTRRRVYSAWVAVLLLPSVVLAAPELDIIHIRVGQGDATLILGPRDMAGDRVSVLIDAGGIPIQSPRDGGNIVSAVLWKNGVRELDHFIATHYDADHVGGVVTGRPSTHGRSFLLGPDDAPGQPGDDDGDGDSDWLDAGQIHPDPEELGTGDDLVVLHFVDRGDERAPGSQTYKKYVGMATAKGRRTSLTTKSDVNGFEIDLGGGATMYCLAANGFVRKRSGRVANVNTENERSLAFLLRYGGFDYLTGGDTIGRTYGSENAEVETAIAEFLSNEGIAVDVLHVNHHGGNNASDLEFLMSVAPEVAVISLGNDNPHGHPHSDVLGRLVDAGVYRIYQTSWGTTEGVMPDAVRRHQAIFQGDVVIRTDGDSYDVLTIRNFEVDH